MQDWESWNILYAIFTYTWWTSLSLITDGYLLLTSSCMFMFILLKYSETLFLLIIPCIIICFIYIFLWSLHYLIFLAFKKLTAEWISQLSAIHKQSFLLWNILQSLRMRYSMSRLASSVGCKNYYTPWLTPQITLV